MSRQYTVYHLQTPDGVHAYYGSRPPLLEAWPEFPVGIDTINKHQWYDADGNPIPFIRDGWIIRRGVLIRSRQEGE